MVSDLNPTKPQPQPHAVVATLPGALTRQAPNHSRFEKGAAFLMRLRSDNVEGSLGIR